LPEAAEKKNDYEKALAAFTQANKAFRGRDWKKASELFRAFIEKYSPEKDLADRARMYLMICEGRERKETSPLKTAEDHYQMAVFKQNLGEYDEALELLDRALEKAPEDGRILYMRALTQCLTGKTEECLESLKEAVKADAFYRILARNESGFEPLWEDKKFKLITKTP